MNNCGQGNIEQRTSNAQRRKFNSSSPFDVRCWTFDVGRFLNACPPLFTLALLAALALLPTACRRDTAPTTPPAPDNLKTTILLNWFPEAEHGGFYAALVHGYFAEEGLSVEILPGGPGASVVPRVATGQVHFGVENADHVVLARARSAGVIAVLAPIQMSPRCIMVHASSGITNFSGLHDLTLAMNPGGAFAHYLQKKIPLTNVRIVPYGGNVSQFALDPALAQQAYVFSEPFAAREAGADPRCLLLSDIGFNPYTSCLLAGERLLRENPTLVRAVVRASVRGWEQYLRDPAQTHARIHALNPEMRLPLLDFAQAALKPLIRDPQTSDAPFGAMTLNRWETLVGQLAELGLITAGAVQPESCFTTNFLFVP